VEFERVDSEMKLDYCVGITGGMASGKSTLAKMFERNGVPVFYADAEAKACYEDPDLLAQLRKITGPTVFSDSGTLLRPALAHLIFNEPDKRSAIEGLVHPEVRKRYENWTKTHTGNCLYHIREAAILIESGTHATCDEILLVCAPENIRIQRAMERDKLGEEDVRRRMKTQWNEDRKRPYATFCLENLSLDEMENLFPVLHRLFSERARKKSMP